MTDKKYAVEVNNIKKSFYLPRHKNDSLKKAITQVFKPKDKGGDRFDALNGVSFKVEKGDFFGILGRNGSGKSTLLKIISEIYQPSSGSVRHDGKLVSFIELGVGFKPELSGRENVFLNGALLGFARHEIEDMYDDIVEFAELERFMDQKLKNYSSGMKVRLAFSVAIRAKADILVLDEVLAVGDADFQRKCYNYFEELKEGGKTIIFVTHSMAQVKKFCNKAILIEDGKIVESGDAENVANAYTKLFDSKPNKSKKKVKAQTESVSVVDMKVSHEQDKLVVAIILKNNSSTELSIDIILDIVRVSEGKRKVVAGTSSAFIQKSPVHIKAESSSAISFIIDNIMTGGEYEIGLLIKDYSERSLLYSSNGEASFTIDSNKSYMPVIVPAQLNTDE